ncbi:MAG: hypothetical protein HY900_15550 [Deltaproteobacteria bacterium]|nr:hypothetical protein [Deltaproteobacteria bacterium]
MQLQAELNSLEESFAFHGALAQPPFSGRALLASILLHVLVVAGVLWFSGGEHKPANAVFFMDLKTVAAGPGTTPSATAAPVPKPQAAAPEKLPANVLPAEALDPDARKVSAAAPAEAPPPEPVQPTQEARAEEGAPADAAAAQAGSPAGVKPPEGMSEAELNYRRAVWETVKQVTLPWSIRSTRWLFEGYLSFHMCLDASGRLLHEPVLLENEEGRRHMDVHAVPRVLSLAPSDQLPAFLDWHFKALVQGIRLALEKAQPYPPAPPGLIPPENMAFPIELNAYDPHHPARSPG